MPRPMSESTTFAVRTIRDGDVVKVPAEMVSVVNREILRAIVSRIPEMVEANVDPAAWWQGGHSWD